MAVSRDDIQDSTGIRSRIPGRGATRALGTATTPTPTNAATGFAPGCIWQNPLATVAGTFLYVNIGTSTSATWVAIA